MNASSPPASDAAADGPPKVSPCGQVEANVDALVVGAGVVGLACAERLSAAGLRVLVVERHPRFGQETSSRNSEVIHAGLYYPPESLKARLCVEGRRLLYEWCVRHEVPHKKLGKYIVATGPDDEAALARLEARAKDNGVEAVRYVSGAELARREPNVIATAALHSGATGIVDSHAFMASLLTEARAKGADVAFRCSVDAIEPRSGGFDVRVRGEGGSETIVRTRVLVNAAGLESDRVAALAGIDVERAGYTLRYVKGRYARLLKPGWVRSLIYPVPRPDLLGLGVHVTVDLSGGLRLGPDAVPIDDRRVDYAVPDSIRAPFFEAASRYLRGIALEDIAPDYAGIRPRLATYDGPSPDFIVREESDRGLPGLVNLIGIESPGLTSALAIGREVQRLVGI